jgi:hypothetical protein
VHPRGRPARCAPGGTTARPTTPPQPPPPAPKPRQPTTRHRGRATPRRDTRYAKPARHGSAPTPPTSHGLPRSAPGRWQPHHHAVDRVVVAFAEGHQCRKGGKLAKAQAEVRDGELVVFVAGEGVLGWLVAEGLVQDERRECKAVAGVACDIQSWNASSFTAMRSSSRVGRGGSRRGRSRHRRAATTDQPRETRITICGWVAASLRPGTPCTRHPSRAGEDVDLLEPVRQIVEDGVVVRSPWSVKSRGGRIGRDAAALVSGGPLSPDVLVVAALADPRRAVLVAPWWAFAADPTTALLALASHAGQRSHLPTTAPSGDHARVCAAVAEPVSRRRRMAKAPRGRANVEPGVVLSVQRGSDPSSRWWRVTMIRCADLPLSGRYVP